LDLKLVVSQTSDPDFDSIFSRYLSANAGLSPIVERSDLIEIIKAMILKTNQGGAPCDFIGTILLFKVVYFDIVAINFFHTIMDDLWVNLFYENISV
jgi:hypothetical protein